MDRAQTLLKGHAAHDRGSHHLGPRFQVTPIRDGARKKPRASLDALERDGVTDRVKADGEVGLEVVGHGVHPRRGGDIRGKAERQRGVGERDARNQVGAEDDGLSSRGLERNHGASANVAAGAGGGGDGNHRRQVRADSLGAVAEVVIFLERQTVGCLQANGLRGVERAASAHTDDAVAVFACKNFHAREDAGFGGIRFDAVEQFPGNSRG